MCTKDDRDELDVWTDNPRLEAALLTAFFLGKPFQRRIVEIHYEEVGMEKRVIRVDMNLEFEEEPIKQSV